ncbi:hypothetical protein FOL46_009142 [Perkinsus olseni]|uniref:Uncharacterized protein n=1 Tax=Perkinsus olseni TaxID=32597 RepID=A0A7J6MWW1_PEROL|nr:hypothetical protein FOL46_009142 [Perkinsus olseni]
MSLPETDAAAILASALLEPDIGAAILAALQGPRDHRASSSLSSTSVLSPSNRGEEGRRRASKALTEIDTVVMKNLAGDVTKAEIVETLMRERLPLPPIGIEFHLDARGTFRGTVFVKFPTQRSAAACVEAFQPPNSPCRIGGRKVRLGLSSSRKQESTSRDVMEASLSREKQDMVKKLVDDFLADDRQREAFLPSDLDAAQRKYAHAIAEKAGLVHTTQLSPTNSMNDDIFVGATAARSPKRAVYLSKVDSTAEYTAKPILQFRVSSGRSSSKRGHRTASDISFSMDLDDFSPSSIKSKYSGAGSSSGMMAGSFGHGSGSSALFTSASSTQGDGLLPLPFTPPLKAVPAGQGILESPHPPPPGLADASLNDSRTLKFATSESGSPLNRSASTPSPGKLMSGGVAHPEIEVSIANIADLPLADIPPPPGFEHLSPSRRSPTFPTGEAKVEIDEGVLGAHIANISKSLADARSGTSRGGHKFNRESPEFVPSNPTRLGLAPPTVTDPSAEAAAALNESIGKLLDT